MLACKKKAIAYINKEKKKVEKMIKRWQKHIRKISICKD